MGWEQPKSNLADAFHSGQFWFADFFVAGGVVATAFGIWIGPWTGLLLSIGAIASTLGVVAISHYFATSPRTESVV